MFSTCCFTPFSKCYSVLSAAGDAKVYERILDYNKIVEALNLPKGLPDANPFHSRPCKNFNAASEKHYKHIKSFYLFNC